MSNHVQIQNAPQKASSTIKRTMNRIGFFFQCISKLDLDRPDKSELAWLNSPLRTSIAVSFLTSSQYHYSKGNIPKAYEHFCKSLNYFFHTDFHGAEPLDTVVALALKLAEAIRNQGNSNRAIRLLIDTDVAVSHTADKYAAAEKGALANYKAVHSSLREKIEDIRKTAGLDNIPALLAAALKSLAPHKL